MEVVGYAAGALTTVCWLPQLRRAIRTRSARDISWLYLVVLTVGVSAWIAYGIGRGDDAIVVANAVTFALLVWLAGVKLVLEPGTRRHPAALPSEMSGADPRSSGSGGPTDAS
jgi:MtN3 and saliva related transmembrane protein